jgi:hypothetical protein
MFFSFFTKKWDLVFEIVGSYYSEQGLTLPFEFAPLKDLFLEAFGSTE